MSDAPVPIQTERLILRDFVDSDWEAAHTYASRDEVVRYMAWGPNTEHETKDFVARAIAGQQSEPRRSYELAISTLQDSALIGGVSIERTSDLHESGVIGYCLHPDTWGRGFATEAARAIVGFGFTYLELHRITTTCDTENVASRRVLEKCGMRRECTLRHNMRIRGEWRDSYLYEILVDEWSAKAE